GLMRTWLAAGPLSDDQADMLRSTLAALGQRREVQQLVAESLARRETPVATRLALLEVIQRSELAQFPTVWRHALAAGLADADTKVLRLAIATIAARGDAGFTVDLGRIAADSLRPADIRVEAAAAFVQGAH